MNRRADGIRHTTLYTTIVLLLCMLPLCSCTYCVEYDTGDRGQETADSIGYFIERQIKYPMETGGLYTCVCYCHICIRTV
jgi:hypothetical protein